MARFSVMQAVTSGHLESREEIVRASKSNCSGVIMQSQRQGVSEKARKKKRVCSL